jgi:hypothetical protein
MSSNNDPNRITLTPLTPEDFGGRRGGKSVTLDKQGRLSLSSALRRELGITGMPAFVYVSSNVEQKVIGIVKADVVTTPPNAKQAKVDKRGYTNGKPLLDKFGLPQASGPYRFEYLGKIDSNGADWHAFRFVPPSPKQVAEFGR